MTTVLLSVVRTSFFFSTIPPPPRSTLFPYTTLFRSDWPRTGRVRWAHTSSWSAWRPATCAGPATRSRSEEHTSELQSQSNLVCRLLLEKKHFILLQPIYIWRHHQEQKQYLQQ